MNCKFRGVAELEIGMQGYKKERAEGEANAISTTVNVTALARGYTEHVTGSR